MNKAMGWAAARLSEKSTYTGVFTLIMLFAHHSVSDPLAQSITTAGLAIGGLLTTIMAENPNA